jgi:hypothetical protein
MANYAVFLEGNDFALNFGGVEQAVGFFITVRVEAHSEEAAATAAIAIVRADPRLAEAFSGATLQHLRLEPKVVHELPPENRMENTGFVFFPMEEA